MRQKPNTYLLNIAIKKGDDRAFKTVFETHYVQLTKFVNFYTNNEATTKDVVQETFIKLWEHRKTIDDHTSILSLLYKIAYNIFIDNYRKEKRKKIMLDDFSYKRLTDLIEEDRDVTEQKIKRLEKVISELPPKCQKIFRLSKYEGLKYKEIAESLNISVKTVEVQMGKAFSKIRNALKKV